MRDQPIEVEKSRWLCNECPYGPDAPIPEKGVVLSKEYYCGIAHENKGEFFPGTVMPRSRKGKRKSFNDCRLVQTFLVAFPELKQLISV